MLVRSKSNYDYSTYDDRALLHDGCIVDVGCAGWDMFASLVGKKRIIGVDPFEEEKEGFEFYKGILGPIYGEAWITDNSDESTNMFYPQGQSYLLFRSVNWKLFCQEQNIDRVSILKLNIEGAEYPLLHSMDTDDFEKIDQIMVSFHDWINPKWKHLTQASHHLLIANNFELGHVASQYGWHLYLKK